MTPKIDQNETLLTLVAKSFVRHMPLYLLAITALFFTHQLQASLPFMAKELGDLLSERRVQDAPLLSYLLVALGIVFFRALSRVLFFYPARLVQKNLKVDFIHRLENTHPNRYEHYNAGQIFQLIQNDFESVRAVMGFAILQITNVAMAMVVLLPKLHEFNSHFMLPLLPMLLGITVFSIIIFRRYKYYFDMQQAQGEVQNEIVEVFRGKDVITQYSAEKAFIANFQRKNEYELSFFFKAGLGSSFAYPVLTLGMGLSIIWGAFVAEKYQLGASAILLFSSFTFLINGPLSYFSWVALILNNAQAAFNRLKSFYSVLDAPAPAIVPSTLLPSYALTIDYWDKKLDLKLERGHVYCFIAETGHGKSLLLKKIAEEFLLRKQQVAMVFQTPYLFHDTLENNLFLNHQTMPTAQDRAMALELLDAFELTELKEANKELLQTEIGERAKNLSGGQAKRVALVRSILSGAQILLWDDPFSSVDIVLEKKIITKLKKLGVLEGKIVLLTTHRRTTFLCSDFYYYLNSTDGLIEFGETRKNIADDRSKSYEFFKKQMGAV